MGDPLGHPQHLGGVEVEAAVFRQHFPIFADAIHMCSCSEGALSDRVEQAMAEFMSSWRIHAAPWEYWMAEVERARVLFAHLIHANPEDVAAVSCASEAAFQAAWAQNYQSERRTIVTTDLEFPSISHVWLSQVPQGAEVRFVRHRDGLLGVEDYAEAIDASAALVSVPLVSYANGLKLPVADISDLAHRAGSRVVVDAYQGAGVMSLDVRTLGADYLFAGTLKYLLGAPGLAFLWVNPSLAAGTPPVLTGWFGRKNPFAFTPEVLDYAPGALQYQTGTPAIPAAFAGAAGLSLVTELDMGLVERHISGLADVLQAGLAEQGWRFYSPSTREQRGPQVTILTQDAEGLAAFLRQRRIFASPRGQALRLSLHYYNNLDDVAAVVDALGLCRGRFRG